MLSRLMLNLRDPRLASRSYRGCTSEETTGANWDTTGQIFSTLGFNTMYTSQNTTNENWQSEEGDVELTSEFLFLYIGGMIGLIASNDR